MIKRVLSVLVALALFVAPITANPGMVKAMTVGTVLAAPVAPSATNVQVSIEVNIVTPLVSGDVISIWFQSPLSISPASKTVTVSGATVTSASASSSTLTIQIGSGGLAAGLHTIAISSSTGITNPSSAGPVSMYLWTTREASSVQATYTVVAGTQPAYLYYFSDTWIAGSAASHYITFAPSSVATQPAPATTVSVQFPAGTAMPSLPYTYTNFTLGGMPVIAASVTGTRLDITVPAGVTGSTSYQIVIPSTFQIKHTTTVSTSNVLQLWTTGDQSPQSFTFSTQGGSVTIQSVSVSPLTPSTVAQFAITFYTSSSGTGIKSGDTIRIEFPAGTQFPAGSFCPTCFVINGQVAQTAPTRVNNVVTITVPTTLPSATQFVYLTIGTTANIINPSTAGSYSLKVSTSLDTTQVTSSQYTLVGTSIASLAVTATPTSQSAYPELRFTFTTSGSGALTTGDYIYIQIPSSMNPPSSIAASATTVNGTQVATASSVTSDRLAIRMPVSVGNSQQVTVVIAATSGLRNPSTVGTSVSFDVSTSQDVGTRSISYTTTISQIAPPQVTLTTNGVGKPSGYTVVFNTGAGGLLSAGSGQITLIFPAGTVVPGSISGQNVRVNGSIVSVVSSNSTTRRVEVRTPVAIQASTQVTVVIDMAAGIVNPSNAGTSYVLSAYTTAETTLVNSAAYAIVNLPVSTAVTYPVNPDGLNGYYRTRPSVTITATSPSGYPVSIYYRINTGSDTLYAGPVQIPDGNVTITYYARDSQSNQEAPRQLTFKVDATAPVVTILTPQGGSVTGTAIAAITGRTEAGATVTINGSAVAVQPSGDFGGSVTLTEGANSIQVVATDLAGNVGQTTVAVTLDTKPPVLTVTSPKIYATVMTHQVTVTGRTEPGATLHIAGTTTEVAADGTFSFVYMFPKDGLNVIDITATDASGNTARASIPVTYVARTLIRLQVGNKTAMINDAVKALQAAPVNIKGTVMVPIRLISEAFGATVEWEPVFKLVRLQLGDKVIYLQIGSKSASVNGKSNTLLAAPIIVSGTTMVPIRFISEAFDALVVWIEATKGIEITYPKP
jgi:hypothetical protein